MPVKFDTTLMRLVKDVNEIKSALRRTVANLPLFDIANENTPASLSTDQNDYAPGNYDVLRINATANISITGFANGKKGRFLEIINVGTGRISYPDESASSIAINRISTPYDQTVVQLTNARIRFYYDSTNERWTISDPPNIQGEFGRFAIVSHSSTTVQTVAAFTEVDLELDTVVSDDWGYWDATNKYFVIPSGESGLYSLSVSFYWSVPDSVDWNYILTIYKNLSLTTNRLSVLVAELSTGLNIVGVSYFGYFSLTGGDKLLIQVQNSPLTGTPDRDVKIWAIGTPALIFAKVS